MDSKEMTEATFSGANNNKNHFRAVELSQIQLCSGLCSLHDKDHPISDDPNTKTIRCSGEDGGDALVRVSTGYLSFQSWCQVIHEAKPVCGPFRFNSTSNCK